MKTIYLAAGKDGASLLKALAQQAGICQTQSGLATDKSGQSSTQCFKVVYNPKILDICGILALFFECVDPYASAASPAERTWVYYDESEDVFQIEYYFSFMNSRGAEPYAACGNLLINDAPHTKAAPKKIITGYSKLVGFTEA